MQHPTHITKDVESMISQEAYDLVTDPTRLLSLLYSKYGDIDEDYNYMYLNPIIYSKSSHILSQYKEYQYMDNSDEYLKRFYAHYESEDRLPRLSEYYKNYHLFFCRPVFRNWILTHLMHSYGDNQAEIFYKNNYANNESEKHTSHKHNQSEDESLSSLDNITNNKTIFDKKIRCIIDNNNKQSNCTNTNKVTASTLVLDVSKGNCGLISKRSKNNSFVNLISGMFQQQQQNIKVNTATPNNNNSNNNCYHNGKIKSMRMKSSLCTLTKAKIEAFPAGCNCNFPVNGNGGTHNNNNNHQHQHSNAVNNNNKILLSPKLKPYLTTFKSNFAEFNKNKPKYNYNNYNHYNSIPIKNKTSYNNNNGHTHNHNNVNHQNKFSKLSTSNTKNSLMATMTMPPNGTSLNSNTISINGNPSCTNRRVHSNISSTINSGISSTLNSAIHNNNPHTHQRINSAFQTKKNKTYDIQYNNTNHNTRLHKPTKTKYKTSSLSKLSPNPLKTPLSKTTSSSNNTILHPSSSIPRYSTNSKQCSSTKNSIHVKHNTKHIDSLSCSNLITNNQKMNVVQSQRCSKNKNGINVKSPSMVMTQRKKGVNNTNNGTSSTTNYNSINNNVIYSHGRGIFNSRNKKSLQKNIVQTIRSSKCKNTTHNTNNTNTNHHYTNGVGGKSVDDKKDKQCGGGTNVRKLLSELTAGKGGNVNNNSNTNQDKKYEMSDKFINQIEELIKKAKFGSNSNSATTIVRKSSHGGGERNYTNKNCYVNHHQHSKSNGINECNSNNNNVDMQYGSSTRGNSMKPINVNLNTNLRMKSSERKSNVRMLSPKI